MFGFRTKKKRPPGSRRLQDVQNPLEIVPAKGTGAEWKEIEGGIRVRFRLPDRNKIERWTARVFGMKRQAEINFDQMGSAYWRLLDGKRNLRQIAHRLGKEFDLQDEKSREATVTFTKQLLMRGIITIRLTDQEQQAWRAT